MRTVDLSEEQLNLGEIIELARQGPVLVVALDGQEFLLAEVDDFEQEIEALRGSEAFQHFLDMRAADGRTIPLENIERAIDDELAKQDRVSGK